MILSFQDRETERLFHEGQHKKLPKLHWDKACAKLDLLDHAKWLEDLNFPNSNRFHRLQGFVPTRYSISINMQYRITFAWDGEHATQVMVEDYH